MKKIIYILGILFLGIIIILNLLFTAYLDPSEHINISFNNWMYTIGVILVALLVYILTKIIDKFLYNNGESRLKKNLRRTLFVIVIAVYIVFNVMWLLSVNPPVVGDSVHVCNLAQTFYRNDPDQFLNNETYFINISISIPASLMHFMNSIHLHDCSSKFLIPFLLLGIWGKSPIFS